jgi:hypothetical protein
VRPLSRRVVGHVSLSSAAGTQRNAVKPSQLWRSVEQPHRAMLMAAEQQEEQEEQEEQEARGSLSAAIFPQCASDSVLPHRAPSAQSVNLR